MQKVLIVFNYLILFYLKEQETIKVVADDGAAVQNTCLNHTSLPEERIAESYTVINSFSELLTVIFQSNTFFSQSYMDHMLNYCFSNFQGAMTDAVLGEF